MVSFKPASTDLPLAIQVTLRDVDEFLSSVRSSELNFGGAYRDRTDDPLLAKQVLSQLSYGPNHCITSVVGLGGFEPPTSPLSGVRSNQLSYRP